jgi:hypothetical protein
MFNKKQVGFSPGTPPAYSANGKSTVSSPLLPVSQLEWRFYLGYALCPLILPLLSTIYGEVGQ